MVRKMETSNENPSISWCVTDNCQHRKIISDKSNNLFILKPNAHGISEIIFKNMNPTCFGWILLSRGCLLYYNAHGECNASFTPNIICSRPSDQTTKIGFGTHCFRSDSLDHIMENLFGVNKTTKILSCSLMVCSHEKIFYLPSEPTVRSDCMKTVGSNGCRAQFYLQSDRTVGSNLFKNYLVWTKHNVFTVYVILSTWRKEDGGGRGVKMIFDQNVLAKYEKCINSLRLFCFQTLIHYISYTTGPNSFKF